MKRAPMKRRRMKIPPGKADVPKPADPFDTDFAEIIGAVLGGGRVPELEKEGDIALFWGFRIDPVLLLKLVRVRMMADLPQDADRAGG